MLEQVRQLFLLAVEVVQAHTHHQADRHMIAFVAGFKNNLQTVGQQVALDPRTIEGEGVQATDQQANEGQATHGRAWVSR
ncbi:hypothetical protein D3C79_1013500 [compost metagenome]